MAEQDKKDVCAWCEAIRSGKVGIYPTYNRFCRDHLGLWLHVASHALAYQLGLITKGKWVAELQKAKQEAAAVCGVHLIQMGKEQVPKPEGRWLR